MVRLCLDHKFDEALKIHFKVHRAVQPDVRGLATRRDVKCALNALGMVSNELRLALVPTRLSTNEKIHSLIAALEVGFRHQGFIRVCLEFFFRIFMGGFRDGFAHADEGVQRAA